MKCSTLWATFFFSFCLTVFAQHYPDGEIDGKLFPFVLSYDAPDNITNLAPLLDAPAGKHGFVRAEKGRFVTDAGPIRFWGTNLTTIANMPEKPDAEKLADRLARFGLNGVRLHMMDGGPINGDDPKSFRPLDPDRLDRLDYLVAALKKRGIYVNINLQTFRTPDQRDGFPDRKGRPYRDRGLNNFYPSLVEIQKEYARDLLTHRNPYTGTTYTEEPAVAMIEINNENGMFAAWTNRMLDLPEPFASEYQKQWNDWLKKKYGTSEKMYESWNIGSGGVAADLIPKQTFDGPVDVSRKPWRFQLDETVEASWAAVPDGGGKDERIGHAEGILRITVKQSSPKTSFPQIIYHDFPIEKGRLYDLSFKIRSNQPDVNLMVAVDRTSAPWGPVGYFAPLKTTRDWKTVRARFVGKEDCPKARFRISGFKPGVFEIDDLALSSGHADNERLEDGTVPVVHRDTILTDAMAEDVCAFMTDVERRYFLGMDRFLKDELKVRQPVSGTQIGYSSPLVQAELDYVDIHGYWTGVRKGARKRPDIKKFETGMETLSNSPDDPYLLHLASSRFVDKPHTLSEVNMPMPYPYGAEGHAMLCALARFQGWSGVFHYTYARNLRWEQDFVPNYFEGMVDTVKLAHFPACFAFLVRGDVREGTEEIVVPVSPACERETFVRERTLRNFDFSAVGLDPRLALLRRTSLSVSDSEDIPERKKPDLTIPGEQRVFVNETGELCWNVEETGGGYFTVDTERAKFFTGFIRGRSFKIGQVELSFGKTLLDWATVSLVSLEKTDRSERYLLSATGLMKNRNMKLVDAGDGLMKLENGSWGEAPVLCEGIPLTLQFAGKQGDIRYSPLDPGGNRTKTLNAAGGAVVCKPEFETIWYEIEIEK